MRKLTFALLLLCAASCPSFGRGLLSGYCTQGGQTIQVLGYQSSAATPVQASYTGTGCNVLVTVQGGPSGYVSTSGTTVTWVSGSLFNPNGQWSGLTVTISGVPYTISSCSGTTSCTVTSSPGTQTSVAYSMPATAPAAIYSNNTGTAKPNPFSVATNGYWFAYADNGVYAISYSGVSVPSPFSDARDAVDPATIPDWLVYNQSSGTFAQQCNAAALVGWSLVISQPVPGLATQTITCDLLFTGSGRLQAAGGQTVTISSGIDAPLSQIFDFSAGGTFLLTGPAAAQAQWFGIVGDGATDNTTALGYIGGVASTVHFPAGTYLACGATISNPVTLYGDGPFSTFLMPYGGASCSGEILAISTTGAVSIHDLTLNGGRTNQQTFAASNLVVTGATSVKAYNLVIENAFDVGLQCTGCSNVEFRDSSCSQNYFICASFASNSTTASPTYLYGFNIHGIHGFNEPYSIALNFFLSDISMTGNVLSQSGIALVQTPHAHAAIEGNTFDGIPSQGCFYDNNAGCGNESGYNTFFFEGAGDVTIGVNRIKNISTAVNGAFVAQGSSLQLPPGTGTKLDLPIHDFHVDGVTVDDSSVGYPCLISAESNGNTPTYGANVTVKNTVLKNVNQGCNVTAVIGGELSNTTVIGAANGGNTVSQDSGFAYKNNVCRNCNTAGGTTYSTGTASGSSGSASITGSGTTWTSGMVNGGFTVNGTTYTICSRSSNTAITLCSPLVTAASSASYSLYYGGGGNYPCLTLAGTNTFNVPVSNPLCVNDAGNNVSAGILDSTTLTPAQSLITYTGTDAGSCVTANGNCTPYSPVPTFTPTLTSGGGCGTSPSIVAGSTNAVGQLTVGSGTVNDCTITFAGSGWSAFGGSVAVVCQIIFSAPFSGTINALLAGNLATYYEFATTVNMAGLTAQYICTSPGGQANRGQYPWPYFWQ